MGWAEETGPIAKSACLRHVPLRVVNNDGRSV